MSRLLLASLITYVMAIEQSAQFAPLRRRDGYLPLEDHGLIGDGATAARHDRPEGQRAASAH